MTTALDALSAQHRLNELEARFESAQMERAIELIESPQPVRVPWTDYPQYENAMGGSGFRPPYIWSDIRDRTEDRYRPLYENNNDLRRMRARARTFEAMFPIAIGARDGLTDYVIGKGVSFKAQPKAKGGENLAAIAQKELDKFCEYNRFCGGLDREIHEKSRVDGECFPTLYPEDENIRCELTEPDAIVEPANKAQWERHLGCAHKLNHWWLGIHTHYNHDLKRDDVTRPIGYHAVFDAEGDQFDYLPASRVEHIKRNVGRSGRRGWSDYEAVYERMEQEAKLERNTAVGAAILAAIAYFRQHAAGTSRSSIDRMIGENSTTSYNRQTDSGARATSIEQVNPGTVKDINSGMEVVLGPLGTLRSPIYIEVAQFILRIISVRWRFPEYLISGDASNNNLNSAMMADGSAAKAREGDQGFYVPHYESIAWKVLYLRWQCKAFGSASWQQVASAVLIKATLPDVATKDMEKIARENETYNRMGIKSKRTIAGELALDYDEEQRNIAREPKAAPDPLAADPKYAAMTASLEQVRSRAEVNALLEIYREKQSSDQKWITTNSGAKLRLDDDGKITAGPAALKGQNIDDIEHRGAPHKPEYKENPHELRQAGENSLKYNDAFARTQQVEGEGGKNKRVNLAPVHSIEREDGSRIYVDKKGRAYRAEREQYDWGTPKQLSAQDSAGLADEAASNISKWRKGSHEAQYRFDSPAEDLAKAIKNETGLKVAIEHPDDSSSRYVYVDMPAGGQYKIRFADHPQPMEGGKFVGGYDKEKGKRHSASDVSIDPDSGESRDSAMKALRAVLKSGGKGKLHESEIREGLFSFCEKKDKWITVNGTAVKVDGED